MKTYCNLMLLLIGPFFLQAQTTYPSGATGCIARWTFDTTDQMMLTSLPDKSGNNNHGTTYDIASVPGFRNKPNSAGGFNGISSWTEVQHNSGLNLNNLTIISLVNFSAFYNGTCQGNQILSKGFPYFIQGNYGQGLVDTTDCNNFSGNSVRLVTQAGNFNSNFPNGNFINLNAWYFLASVIKGDSIKQYQLEMDTTVLVNTIPLINNVQSNFAVGTNSLNISIGKHLNPIYPYWIYGKMDEVVLFNRALSSSEIHGVYNYLWGNALGIEDINTNNPIITYERNRLFIKSPINNFSIRIYNCLGQLIFEKKNCKYEEQVDLNINSNQILILKCFSKDKWDYTQKLFCTYD